MSHIQLPPMHPGEVLWEDFMVPMDLTSYALGKRLHVDRQRVERIIKGTASISPDTAIRLATVFGNSPEFWLNLQTRYALLTATEKLKSKIADIQPFREPVAA